MDYSEILMQSMDVFVSKRLSELQFDKTIIVQIVDDTNAEHGEYEVTDGSTTFTAYSKDVTFKTDESVYVTIPNGNYDNQKQIIGKYVGDGESLTYISPLDSYVDITGDLCNFTAGASLLANRVYDQKTDGPINYISQKVIWKTKIQNGKGFERLGIQADFKTWLKKLKVNSGNFGLCLYITYIEKATVNSEDLTKVKAFVLDSDSMYGNPYNFESFYTQQKTFDLSEINGQITDMKLVFYQDYNFGTTTGDIAATKDKNGNWLIDNIYVNNIHVSMGYDIAKFDKDTVLVYTTNEPTYNYNNLTQENHKVLQTRWVRCTKEGIYAIDAADEIPENASIHWYKYQIKIQDEVDELAGPFWFEIKEGLNKLQIEVDPDVNEISQLYKVVIEVPSRQWIENQLDEEMNAEYKELVFQSTNPALSEEDLEEAISQLEIYEDNINSQRQIIASEPLEFKSEVPVIDKMTADLINGLEIIVDEKGYKGNYLLYNLSNQIQNANESTKLRILKATYKSLVTGEQTLDGAESIIWKIPLTNTMIYPPEDGKEYSSSDKVTSYWVENGYAYIKRMSGNSNSGGMGTVNDWSCEQKFRIKDYYQESATNNTVYCYVVKNSIAYEASSELAFGPMGSNGTDFTFRMTFDSDIPGVTENKTQILAVNLSMFDFNNEKVPNFWSNGVNVSWYHRDAGKAITFCDIEGKINDVESVTISDKIFYIKYDSTKGIPHGCILQAQVTADPTVGAGQKVLNAVKLTCHLAIPYRAALTNGVYSGIEGATKILYDSTGTKADYYKEKYRLWTTTQNDIVEIKDAVWQIHSPEFNATGKTGEVVVQEKRYDNNGNEYFVDVKKNSKPLYFPQLTLANTIIVPSMYTELNNNTDRDIYVTATVNGKIVWSQPIMMMRDAYSSTMLNAWDGSLTIDEENGTILSTMIGAGKKDSENRFEGVMMGDIHDAISEATVLGLYGFNAGVQSFGWKVDGTGFIGKSGQGQILFDGNRGTISSGIWQTSGNKLGMEIDLDGPTQGDNWNSTGSSLKMYGAAGQINIDTSETSTNLFNVKGRKQDNLVANGAAIKDPSKFQYQDMIKISLDIDKAYNAAGEDEVSLDTSFFLQSLGYKANETGTRLDLQNGYLYSFGKYGRIQFSTGEKTFFRLADKDNKVLFVIKSTEVNDGASGSDASVGTSAYYLQSSNFNSSNMGTRLDLQKGKYSSYGTNGRIEIAPNESTFFRIADRENKVLFILKGAANTDTDGETVSSYYLQSSNFKAGDKTGTRLDLQNGKFTTYGSSGYVIIDSGNSAIFRIYAKKDSSYHPLVYVGTGSTYYIQNLEWATSSGAKGSKWNLNNGDFDAKGDGGSIGIHPDTANGLFVVKTGGGKSIMNVGTNNYYLQSADWGETGKGFRLDLSNGNLTGYNFSMKITHGSNWMQLAYDNTYAINVNNLFMVKWTGDTILKNSATLTVQSGKIQSGGGGSDGKYYSLNENGGTIGPWHINEDGIYIGDSFASATSKLGTDGTIKLTADSMILTMTDTYFRIANTSGATYSYPGLYINASSVGLGYSESSKVSVTEGSAKLMANYNTQLKLDDEDGIDIRSSNGTISIKAGNSEIKISSNGIELICSSDVSLKLYSGTEGLYINGKHAVQKTITLSDIVNRKKLTFVNGLLETVEDGWGGDDIT